MKRMLVALVFLGAAGRPQAASFDCTRASSSIERMICGDAELSQLDERLARAYQEARKSSASKELASAQIAWLKKVRERCADVACLKAEYAARIQALGAPQGFTGTYTSGNGELLIVHNAADRKVRFEVHASSGMNVGELAGIVELRDDAARYEDFEEDCVLTITFATDSAVVAQEGSCGMGLNVSASGTYRRTSSVAQLSNETVSEPARKPSPGSSILVGTYLAPGRRLMISDLMPGRIWFYLGDGSSGFQGAAEVNGAKAIGIPYAPGGCQLRLDFSETGVTVSRHAGDCSYNLAELQAEGEYSISSHEAPDLGDARIDYEKAKKQATTADRKKRFLADALARHRGDIAALGLSARTLKATIYLQREAFVPCEQWLALVFENKKVTKVTGTKLQKNEGIRVKVAGMETYGFLFRFDEGDLFPSHFVKGDNAIPITDQEDAAAVAMAIAKLASDAMPDVP